MKNKIRLIPGTNLYELTIAGKKFYSIDEHSFNISMNVLKGMLIEEFPLTTDIHLSDITLVKSDTMIESEIPNYSIRREPDGKCRVYCELDIIEETWNYDIDATLFLILKRELLLHRLELNPVIEDDAIDIQFLSYSIDGEGSAIDEVVANANAYNENISREITSSVNTIPRLLLDSLGILETSQPIKIGEYNF
jgi:hypothetical protein